MNAAMTETNKMISGFGKYHTNDADPSNPKKKLTPYELIDLAGIREMVDNPQPGVPKDKAQWAIFSTLHSRNKKEQEAKGQFWCLWADIDQGEGKGDNKVEFSVGDPRHKTIDQIHGVLEFDIVESANYEVYASASATERRQKCRIVVPLDKPLSGFDWMLCQEVLNAKLLSNGIVPDAANLSCNQVMYLPNRGVFYKAVSERSSEFFDPMTAWSTEIGEQRQALSVKAAEVARRKAEALERRKTQRYDPNTNPIDAFNEAYCVEEVMLKNSYDQRGDKFRHPASESGSYSASVLDGRVHSLSPSDPLYTGGGGIGAHDAFSAYCILEHGGDVKKAIKYACDHLLFVEGGTSWNKAKQREYMRAKQHAEAEADMKPIDGDEEDEVAPAARTYDDILAEAGAMTEDTPPADIQRLAVECKDLEAVERRKVFMVLKRSTGMPLGTLNDAMKSSEDGQDEPDHLQLASEVIRQLGAENIFEAQSFIWRWSGSGVWAKNEDRAVKQLVQAAIPSHATEVYKSLVDGVTDVLKNEVHRPHHEFNIGPTETVNCPNGEVSLGMGWELHPHVREHYRTTQIPVCYDPTAKAPRFEKFLDEVFAGDPDAREKREAVLQMMGYTLMAHCRHEKFVILVGSGANGKSVLLSILEALVGQKNVAGVQPHQFDNVFQRGHLFCKLANIVSEIRQGEVINDAALKGIVSGELTTVEHKNKDPFEMRPFATCWFGTNHMPHTKDDSNGFFRRALVLTFNNTFTPELGNADPDLKDKLLEELPGILNLALEAYAWAISFDGFATPSSSIKAVEDWKLESDQVAQFLAEECVKQPGTKFPVKDLYDAFKNWADNSGIKNACKKKTFSQRMQNLGAVSERTGEDRFLSGFYCKRAAEACICPTDGSWGYR